MNKVLCIIVLLMNILITMIDTSNLVKETSPNWIGQWAIDKHCNMSMCCCFYGGFTIRENNNGSKLEVIGQLDGIGDCGIKPIIIETIDVPQGFTTRISLLFSDPVNLTLSENSEMISIISPLDSQCNSQGLQHRNDARMIRINMVLLFSLLCSVLGIKIMFSNA